MTIRRTHHLRSALVSAPKLDLASDYSLFYIGQNTRDALITLLDQVELTHRTLESVLNGIEAGDAAMIALRELDEFVS